MINLCSSVLPTVPPKAFYQVYCCGEYTCVYEFNNYDDALNKYNTLKSSRFFDYVDLILVQTLEREVKNGDDN